MDKTFIETINKSSTENIKYININQIISITKITMHTYGDIAVCGLSGGGSVHIKWELITPYLLTSEPNNDEKSGIRVPESKGRATRGSK